VEIVETGEIACIANNRVIPIFRVLENTLRIRRFSGNSAATAFSHKGENDTAFAEFSKGIKLGSRDA
jgi:hypothetical protein